MLKLLEKSELNQYIDLIYSLVIQPESTSYPVYYDGIKTKDEFIRRSYAAYDYPDEEEILVYIEGSEIKGWIHYSYIEDENYLSTISFAIEENFSQAFEEFLNYINNKCPQAEIYIGIPTENISAINSLDKHEFKLAEEAWNDVFHFENFKSEPFSEENIIEITSENFDYFAQIHELNQNEMYWTNERLARDIDNWQILVYLKDGKPLAAIYASIYNGKKMAEIFGIDFFDKKYNEIYFENLLKRKLCNLNKMKVEHLVFFNSDESQKLVLESGFNCIGKYRLYTKKFEM